MTNDHSKRRQFLASLGGVGLGLLIAAPNAAAEEEADEEVSANEDLMREHGIIRRALLVYGEAARRARQAPKSLPLVELGETAALFRGFAEDYHERALEEAHIFPVVRKLKAPVAKLPDVLLAQHQRGREITDYVQRLAKKTTLGADADGLATALESFVRMYEPHAAREDTELFPAWKAALGEHAYVEMGEQFEDIEHRTFGRDGFDDALERIARIEVEFGLADLSAMTAALPPADAR
ncbi:MAG TPA: hemerythrin HHE cation-binding protein [Arenimonas sp.]|nr:hemerythrin HHE cation-binding protein [Arenimonas sp.]